MPERVKTKRKGISEGKHVGHKIPNSFLSGFWETCQAALALPGCPDQLRASINRLPSKAQFVYMDINLQFEEGNPQDSADSKSAAEKLAFHGPDSPRSKILKPVHAILAKKVGTLTFAEIQWVLDEIEKAGKLGTEWSGVK